MAQSTETARENGRPATLESMKVRMGNNPARPGSNFLDRKLDRLYRQACGGGSALAALARGGCSGTLVAVLLPAALLLLAGLLFGLFVAWIHLFGYPSREGFGDGFAAPWRITFQSGYPELFARYGLRLLAGAAAGVLLIAPFFLGAMPLQRRFRLLAGLLGWVLILLFLPGFAALFALGFPFLLLAGHRRWVAGQRPGARVRVLAVVPSLAVLVAVQLGNRFTPRLWLSPLPEVGGLTPSQYWANQEFRKRALQGADAGNVYSLQMVLREFDLSPQQRLGYLKALRQYPNQRTPEIERQYQALLEKTHPLPADIEALPAGLRLILSEDPILNTPNLPEPVAKAQKRFLADRWNEKHPDQPAAGFD
jgi:hypothetical protein